MRAAARATVADGAQHAAAAAALGERGNSDGIDGSICCSLPASDNETAIKMQNPRLIGLGTYLGHMCRWGQLLRIFVS
jgi:hypothetical protein